MKAIKTKKTTAPAPAAVITPAKAPTAPKPAPTPAPALVAAVLTPAPKAAAPAPVSRREITTECIASRAYSLWEQHGRPHGRDAELWLQAESQLKQASQSFAA